jgi:hypothetical protein
VSAAALGMARALWAHRAAIGLMLLIGLAAAWHYGRVERAVDAAVDEIREQAATQARDELIAAQGTWISNVSMLNTLAAVDDAATMKRLAAIETAVRTMTKEYRSHADAAPLPADCVADPDRVRRVNDALER